ncbi:MAG TPA: UDP-glucose/GDP-mannose dehydrogenase family protein [Patescibacteria group bacterium]
MTVTIVGAGYVGLVTAVVFSELGNKVFCIDVDEQRIENLKKGTPPFFEPGLEDTIKKNLKNKRLIFTSSYKNSVPNSKIVFICVGTPPKNNGEADLSQLFSSVESTAKNLKGYTTIAIKSTIPIGHEEELEEIVRKNSGEKFEFAANPEFLREGSALVDAMHPDRIVVGTQSEQAKKILLEIHAPISGERILTDIRSAQLIKYASNALLATKVSFANALAGICELVGADVEAVLNGVGADRRLGRIFLNPGVGYGGSCLPKDVLAFISIADKFGYDFSLLKAVNQINSQQPQKIISKLEKIPNIKLSGAKVAVWGLAFKPNTDDIREAPSLKIIKQLLEKGAKVAVYDPKAMNNAKKIFPDLLYCDSALDALSGASALLLVTEWDEFKQIDLEDIKKQMVNPVIVDGRNFFNPKRAKELGFIYFGVGR